jgi:hypothetical protein
MNEQLKNRLKSFAWRLGMVLVAATVNFLLKDFASLDLGTNTTVVAGLILGEISKYLNTKS